MEPKPVDPLKRGSNVPYLIAIVLMILIGIVAILVITLMRPDKDNLPLITSMLGLIVPTTAAIMALMKSQETHLTVNSQLAQWKEDFSKLMRAEGAKEAVDAEQARVAAIRARAVTEAAVAAATGAPVEPVASGSGSTIIVQGELTEGTVNVEKKDMKK